MAARVMVMAGGTGGHVYPALAVALELRERGWEVFWLGVRGGFESRVVPQHGIPMHWISVSGVRGKGLAALLLAPLRILLAMGQALRVILRERPAVVLGMGGFVSGPGGVMARLAGRPLVIQEQNAIPGLTNRWLSRIASRVYQAFPGSFESTDARVSGNPLRAEIAALPKPAERFAGRSGPVRLLVLGGSLGAQILNEQLPPALALLDAGSRPQVRHQAGRGKLDATREAYRRAGIEAEVSEFVDDMAEAYAWADLVICRSGALTVSELAAAGLGAILVPYAHAVDDHQTHNARYLSEQGAARLLPQSELSAARLAELLRELCGDRQRLLTMAEAAREQALPEATRIVADGCEEVCA